MKVYTIQDCPFCGSDNITVHFKDTWGVHCGTCRAYTTFLMNTVKNFGDVVDAYNRRAKEDGDNGNQQKSNLQ